MCTQGNFGGTESQLNKACTADWKTIPLIGIACRLSNTQITPLRTILKIVENELFRTPCGKNSLRNQCDRILSGSQYFDWMHWNQRDAENPFEEYSPTITVIGHPILFRPNRRSTRTKKIHSWIWRPRECCPLCYEWYCEERKAPGPSNDWVKNKYFGSWTDGNWTFACYYKSFSQVIPRHPFHKREMLMHFIMLVSPNQIDLIRLRGQAK